MLRANDLYYSRPQTNQMPVPERITKYYLLFSELSTTAALQLTTPQENGEHFNNSSTVSADMPTELQRLQQTQVKVPYRVLFTEPERNCKLQRTSMYIT